MVDALIFLRAEKEQIRRLGEASGTKGHGPSETLLMVATGYCILFGYRCENGDGKGPPLPNDYIAAFAAALCSPAKFVEDCIGLRAQGVPRDTIRRLEPLLHGREADAEFSGPSSEVLRQLNVFLHSSLEAAEVYAEIRDCASSGALDRQIAQALLGGHESDQRRMLNAMGGCGGGTDETEQEEEDEDGEEAGRGEEEDGI